MHAYPMRKKNDGAAIRPKTLHQCVIGNKEITDVVDEDQYDRGGF